VLGLVGERNPRVARLRLLLCSLDMGVIGEGRVVSPNVPRNPLTSAAVQPCVASDNACALQVNAITLYGLPMKWVVRIVAAMVALGAGRPVVAQRDFPSPAAGVDLMFRHGQLLTVDFRYGFLWKLPTESHVGMGLVSEVGLGLGGVSGGTGPVAMFNCVHAIGCTSVSLQAKLFRPAFISSWDERLFAGGEIGIGLYLMKFTAAFLRRPTGGDPMYSIGGGLQLFF
jgi:hypothetical protein